MKLTEAKQPGTGNAPDMIALQRHLITLRPDRDTAQFSKKQRQIAEAGIDEAITRLLMPANRRVSRAVCSCVQDVSTTTPNKSYNTPWLRARAIILLNATIEGLMMMENGDDKNTLVYAINPKYAAANVTTMEQLVELHNCIAEDIANQHQTRPSIVPTLPEPPATEPSPKDPESLTDEEFLMLLKDKVITGHDDAEFSDEIKALNGHPLRWSVKIHPGPNFAQKTENQDAICVKEKDGRLFFALADGVSQSFGTRLAARVAVKDAVDRMIRVCTRSPEIHARKDQLEETVRGVNLTLTNVLKHFVKRLKETPDINERASWLEDFLGKQVLPYESTIIFMENTLAPRARMRKGLAPVMGTTLIAGVLEPAKDSDGYRLSFISAGDGIVLIVPCEQVNGRVLMVNIFLDVVPGEMKLARYCGPGEMAKGIEGHLSAQVDIPVKFGDRIVISSDGLSRGSFGERFCDIHEKWMRSLPKESWPSAPVMVERAVAWAEGESVSGKQYFSDNLSLILISVA
jgi:hypothetical protein